MTFDEWEALGLISSYNSFHFDFVNRKFDRFEVPTNTLRPRVFAVTRTGAAIVIGYFDSQSQAELVALTLRMVNPR